jgi:hypothetical protein
MLGFLIKERSQHASSVAEHRASKFFPMSDGSEAGYSDDEAMTVRSRDVRSNQADRSTGPAEAYGSLSDAEFEQPEVPVKRGRGRPRKYPPGTTAYDMLKARRAVEAQQVVIPMKEYGLRLRRELRSAQPEKKPELECTYNPPLRGTLRALMDQDPEFAYMQPKTLLGVKFVQLRPQIEPMEGPRRPRGRPKKITMIQPDDLQDPINNPSSSSEDDALSEDLCRPTALILD